MGFKNVKTYYRIDHIVHVTNLGIVIGSPYILDLIVIGPDGSIVKSPDGGNEDMDRYLREMLDDPAKLRELIAAPDVFTCSLPVYTWNGTTIVEAWCEEYGWPHTTHDGVVMHDNVFFRSKDAAVAAAKNRAASDVGWLERDIAEKEQELASLRTKLAQSVAVMDTLNAAFPQAVGRCQAPSPATT